MRKSVAKCSVALLAVTLVGFVLIFAQIVLPAPAYSRQIPSSLEEGGDPDMPDQVMLLTDKFEGPVSTLEIGVDGETDPAGIQIKVGSSSCDEPRVIRARMEQTVLVLKLWSCISSFVFTF